MGPVSQFSEVPPYAEDHLKRASSLFVVRRLLVWRRIARIINCAVRAASEEVCCGFALTAGRRHNDSDSVSGDLHMFAAYFRWALASFRSQNRAIIPVLIYWTRNVGPSVVRIPRRLRAVYTLLSNDCTTCDHLIQNYQSSSPRSGLVRTAAFARVCGLYLFSLDGLAHI